MSASILCTTSRALPRAIARTTLPTTRAFSIVERARAVAQAAEIQAFERTTISSAGSPPNAKADWGRQIGRVGSAGLIFFPAIGLFLGWPFIAQGLMDGNL